MFSKEVIALAKATVEAIKKITGKERECPKCKGSAFACKLGDGCNGTGKVKGKWEWEPEVGEWFIDTPSGEIYLIDNDFLMEINDDKEFHLGIMLPLLHWERIEEILEGMGYSMIVSHPLDCPDGKRLGYLCMIWHKDWSGDKEIEYVGDTRQEAVMRAVIELGKEK